MNVDSVAPFAILRLLWRRVAYEKKNIDNYINYGLCSDNLNDSTRSIMFLPETMKDEA